MNSRASGVRGESEIAFSSDSGIWVIGSLAMFMTSSTSSTLEAADLLLSIVFLSFASLSALSFSSFFFEYGLLRSTFCRFSVGCLVLCYKDLNMNFHACFDPEKGMFLR